MYTTVTEVPGLRVTREALLMAISRYAFARTFCEGKDVLEVACGAGTGLGLLGQRARRVVGGDFTPELLQLARSHYRGRVPLVRFDGHALPFGLRSFDVVVLFEAVYYFRDVSRCLRECRRVLRQGGTLVVCTINPEWADFNPSPHSRRYLTAQELRAEFEDCGFAAVISAGFPSARHSMREEFVSLLKRAAVRAHLIPRTMRGKEFFKRLFLGSLVPLPAELGDEHGQCVAPVPWDDQHPGAYKVIYAAARAT